MICPFKKNITIETKHRADGTRIENRTVSFGKCEEYECPHYLGIRECGLARGTK